ncbi:peptidoglycan-binding protein [Methylorubrum extorquens]|uniref:Peptidoglycan-binding protein n=1 Tax=Methylorubrum extorquens TaxID=408 RepID=A0AAX3WR75_METEX|nr:peptidoglycan-binding domain-containing protein [Methylobacterium sp. Leaf122]WHQ72599.1 peptidoglycan-binding protein [Methylorubrum extorquens]
MNHNLGLSGADGDAGPRTIAAVTAFQHSAGLVADGVAEPKT